MIQAGETVQVVAPRGTPPVQRSDVSGSVLLGLIVGAVIIAVSLGFILRDRKAQQRNFEMQRRMMQEQNDAQSVSRDRDQVMYEQHRRLNDLHAQKIALEIKLMEAQLSTVQTEIKRREDGGAYHAAMMEKAKLEIESLKLHIHEQRKRLDDYGQFE